MSDHYCECVCNAEWAMRRLLSILRTSQLNCNDIECLPTSTDTPSQSGNLGMFFWIFLWILLVIFLYATRPKSLRRETGPQKQTNGDRENRPPPGLPPVQ